MARYWKLVEVVLVGVLAVVLVAGLLIYGGVEAAKPQPEPEIGATLFTLLNEVEVPAESPLETPVVSDFVDVSGFSTFRVYTRTTSQSGIDRSITFIVTESLDGEVEARFGATGGLGHRVFSGLDMAHSIASNPYRFLGVKVTANNSGEAHTFSVFLHAAP